MKALYVWIALGLAFAAPAIALPAAETPTIPLTAFRLPDDYARLIDAPLQASLDERARVSRRHTLSVMSDAPNSLARNSRYPRVAKTGENVPRWR